MKNFFIIAGIIVTILIISVFISVFYGTGYEGLTGYTPESAESKRQAAKRRQMNRVVLPKTTLASSTLLPASTLE